MSIDMYDYYISEDENFENEYFRELEEDKKNYEYYLILENESIERELNYKLYCEYLENEHVKSHHSNDDFNQLIA